jgi:hypothetical protein
MMGLVLSEKRVSATAVGEHARRGLADELQGDD